MTKRVYYIANSYDGAYFVLTDNIEEYFNRLAGYAMNLQASKKTNHYSFGSIEVTDQEYQQMREEATVFEGSLINKSKSELKLADEETGSPDTDHEQVPEEVVAQKEKNKDRKKPHLRLV